jgi:hypothetical protein
MAGNRRPKRWDKFILETQILNIYFQFIICNLNRGEIVHWILSSSNQAAFKREKHKFGE